MGKELYRTAPAARAVYEAADRALGRSISELCFEGPSEKLTLTANAQPALVTTSMAVLAALRERYPGLPNPVLAAGHSLGEYSALTAASVLSLEDAVRLVELRGQAMQQAVPEGQGGMAAILGGDHEAVRALCDEARKDEVLETANFNAPGQCVLSGSKAAILRAVELAPQRRLKAILLNVSAPFHSSLMAPAAQRVASALKEIRVGSYAFPVVANVTAEPNTVSERTASLLVRQIDGAVLWEQTISLMAEAGITHALELGPGKVLAGLVKRIDKRVRVFGVSNPESIEAAGPFLELA